MKKLLMKTSGALLAVLFGLVFVELIGVSEAPASLAATYDISSSGLDADITVAATSAGQTVKIGDGTPATDDTPIITGTSTTHKVKVTADSGLIASVTIQNLDIQLNSSGAALETAGSGDVKILLDGSNALKSKGNNAGVNKTGSGELIIDAKPGGSLNASGGGDAAGIGSSQASVSRITINGGTINAYGKGGAGIGAGGTSKDAEYITINGGVITAVGDRNSPGIGGASNGWGKHITINGGTVIAKGDPDTGVSDGFAPGIGGGRAGDYITITGGEVTALGGQYAPGIEGDHTVISGGTVYSIGLKGGAGIGSRVDYNCGTVTISGSAIVHAAGGLAGTDNSSHTFGNGASIGEGGQYSPSTADGTPLDLDTVAAGLYTTGAIYCYPTGTTLDQIKNNSVSPSTTRAGTVEFYSVDVTYGAHGTASADVTSGLQGNLVTLTAVPETGYMFKEWQVVSGGVTLANVNDAVTTFSIGTANVSVRAIFEDPSPAPYYPPSSPSEPEPQFGNSQGWSSITNQINNMEPGSNVTVDMNGTTTLPSNVLNAIQGKDVNLVLDMGSGVKWKINGSDVTASTGNLNMAVKVGTSSIPVDVINNLTKERYSIQIELANKGAFGFNAVLTVPIRTQDAGLFANLFRFVKRGASVAEIRAAGDKTDSEEGTFEFVSVGQIAADGSVDLLFDGAATTRDSSGSVYAIVIDNKSLDPNEKSTPTTDSSKIELKATSKQKRITFTWNKVNGAKKYRIFQKVAGVYLPVKTIKASKPAKATVSKALTKIKKNGKTDYEIKTLIVGKKYTFAVCAYVNSKWSEITKTSRVTVKVRK